MKGAYRIVAAVVLCVLSILPGWAQQTTVVPGVVEEIAADGSYLVVSGQRIMTDADFLRNAELLVGDEVEITAEADGQNLRAVDYEYVFDLELPTQDMVPQSSAQ